MTPLRPARDHDSSALVALERACFGRTAWSEASLAEELAAGPETRHVVVAEEAGSVVGYAALLVVGDVADVQRVAVDPSRRGEGHGRDLLVALLVEARRRGCARVLLEVAADNVAALALYAAAGFGEVDRRRGYYGAGRDALVLELVLGPAAGSGSSTSAAPKRRTVR